MANPIYVLNGPNLNRLGTREPEVYGSTTLAQIETLCRDASDGRRLEFRQTNSEREMIEWIQEAVEEEAGIIINPAAHSFTSLALHNALKMSPLPVIELHISNIHRREELYHDSKVSLVATGVIAGLGAGGYPLAVRALQELLDGEA